MFNSEAVNYILYLCREALKEGWKGIHIKLDTYADDNKKAKLEDRPYSYYSASEVKRLLKDKGINFEDEEEVLLIKWDEIKPWNLRLMIKYWINPREIHVTSGMPISFQDDWKEGVGIEPQYFKVVLTKRNDEFTGLPQHVYKYLIRKGWNYTYYNNEGHPIDSEAPIVYDEETKLYEQVAIDKLFRAHPDVVEYARGKDDLEIREVTIPQGVKWIVHYDPETIEFFVD